MADEPPQAPKFTFESELREEKKKNIEWEAKFEDLQSKYKSRGEEVSRLRKATDAQSEPRGEPKDLMPSPVPKIDLPDHAMSITDAYCPTCGDPNPDFKDEIECKDCGHALGAEATLDKVKNCPGCGHEGKIGKRKKLSLNLGQGHA